MPSLLRGEGFGPIDRCAHRSEWTEAKPARRHAGTERHSRRSRASASGWMVWSSPSCRSRCSPPIRWLRPPARDPVSHSRAAPRGAGESRRRRAAQSLTSRRRTPCSHSARPRRPAPPISSSCASWRRARARRPDGTPSLPRGAAVCKRNLFATGVDRQSRGNSRSPSRPLLHSRAPQQATSRVPSASRASCTTFGCATRSQQPPYDLKAP